jgi:hypothetical protein
VRSPIICLNDLFPDERLDVDRAVSKVIDDLGLL